MKSIDSTTHSVDQTRELGKSFGESISSGALCFLTGTLGAGKTRFIQGVANGLQIDPSDVTSPTFAIMVPHFGCTTLVHIDAYRIESTNELDEIGIHDWIDGQSVVMIEWAEKIASALPEPDVLIEIKFVSENIRQFTFEFNNSSLLEKFRSKLSTEG